jgi:hypothetical protein
MAYKKQKKRRKEEKKEREKCQITEPIQWNLQARHFR